MLCAGFKSTHNHAIIAHGQHSPVQAIASTKCQHDVHQQALCRVKFAAAGAILPVTLLCLHPYGTSAYRLEAHRFIDAADALWVQELFMPVASCLLQLTGHVLPLAAGSSFTRASHAFSAVKPQDKLES